MTRQALVVIIILCIISTVASAGDKTLTRQSDPVVIKAADAGIPAGAKIESLRVYALSKGALKAIPYQIDEMTAKDDFVFRDGIEKNPEDGDGLFNGNDELVIMARDLGDGVADLSEHISGYKAAAEISVRDPVDGGRAFAYVLYFPIKAPARSAVDYATIDPLTSRIVTLHYVLGFSESAPMSISELRVTEAGGGDRVDYCDRFKARFHAKVAGISIDKTEEDFINEMVAWIDGPVRVIRRTRSQLRLLWNIPSPSARMDNIYYYNSFSFPVEIYLPIDMGFIVKDARLRLSGDSPRLAGQRRYRNSLYPEGVVQDGKMSELEKTLSQDTRPFTWSSTGTTGPDGKDHGAWFNRLIVKGDNPDWKPRVFYIDDENHLDPPDEEAGSYGNGGYQVDGLNDITSGTYHLESIMYSVPVFEPTMVEIYMRILDHPLEIRIEDIE